MSHVALLDGIYNEMRSGSVELGLDRLRATLADARRRASPEEWSALIQGARAHPLREVLHQDPFMQRCYARPRGYPGDPSALDFVLRARTVSSLPRDRVGQIHVLMTTGPLANALRFRRDCLARTVDDIAKNSARPLQVLAAGAGHLREIERMRSVVEGRIARLVAYESDDACLDTIRRDYAHLPVLARQGTVQQLVEQPLFEDMDIAYCAGLLETLGQAQAAGLVRALFRTLRPGGTLLLANFLRTLPDLGLLETFMDWRMVVRTEGELFDLVKPLAEDSTAAWTYNADPDSTIGILRLTRRG
ncbi:class I SAM-dependent methyltransferase [Usitatibacter palustris]|nr:class I SAM-dependent methyltransferase [Usitatibacter palustris]